MAQTLINFREEKVIKDEFASIAKAMWLTFSGLLKMKMRETIHQAKSLPWFSFGDYKDLTAAQVKALAKLPAAKKLDKTIYTLFGK
jgi:antitoxin component of RelBE/YafQ-DinJ toxin-antitoxin module